MSSSVLPVSVRAPGEEGLACPLKFRFCLPGSDPDAPLTFVTLSASTDRQTLLLTFCCFETFPRPRDYFLVDLGKENPLSIRFSCDSAQLPDGVTLSRDGGENLEGVFWGAQLSVPLSLLPALQGLAVQLRYCRGSSASSPFPDGKGQLQLYGK